MPTRKSTGFSPTSHSRVFRLLFGLCGVPAWRRLWTKVGEGQDPWGGYRAGFAGSTTLKLADFGIITDLGPVAREVEMLLYLEGVRQ